MEMDNNQSIDIARAYLEGMLWAAYGVRIFSCSVAEWQIDAVKKYAKKLKEEEIEHSEISPGETTLGKALKHLEDNGVVIHKVLREGFTKFYVYTNDGDSGIRHALMDDEGAYVPSKDEAYYMLVACSTFVNYLRRKVAP